VRSVRFVDEVIAESNWEQKSAMCSNIKWMCL
jgi:glycerol-3-phosphate cytidylyltransferase-like family protein